MKNLKKLTAMFLIAVMLLSLAACGDSNAVSSTSAPKSKTPVGSWTASVDLTNLFMESMQGDMDQLGLDMDSLPSDVNLDFQMVFTMDLREDGSYHLELSKDALQQTVTQFSSSFEKIMISLMESMFQQEAEAAGLTADEMLAQLGYKTVSELFEASSGSSVSELASGLINEYFDLSDIDFSEDGTYTVDGSSIILTPGSGDKTMMNYAEDSDSIATTVDADNIGTISLNFTRK